MFLQNTKKARLKNLLLITDFENETIYSVIGRMETLLDLFKSNPKLNHLIPFLQTYLFVTKRVSNKILNLKDSYRDYKAIEKLDVYFASLYFKPLYYYLVNGEMKRPWMNYFSYCETEFDSPFTQVLIGINVHINSDLCQSIIDLGFKDKYDYTKVNLLLLETITDTMKYLAINEKDLFGFGGLIFTDFYKKEFEKVIVKWRVNAWRNAESIRKGNQSMLVVQLKTDELSSTIIRLWENFYKPTNAFQLLNKINSLEVVV